MQNSTKYFGAGWGENQFPTGGKVRERKLIRCDSGTDGIVRMKEVTPPCYKSPDEFRGLLFAVSEPV